MSKPIIGLIGKARSGKDTAAEGLARAFGLERRAFADPIKEMLSVGFLGVDFRMGDREKPIEWLGKSPRQIMQTMGTEWGREMVHPDLWIILADQFWSKVKASNAVGLVITDVRFPNEVEWIQSQGGLLIEIVRPGRHPINNHVSESALADPILKVTITNDGSIHDLHRKVNEVFRKWWRLAPEAETC